MVAAVVKADRVAAVVSSEPGMVTGTFPDSPAALTSDAPTCAKTQPEPTVPAVVQTQNAPAWSGPQSPRANVPEVGGPEAVAPAQRLIAVAPGMPVTPSVVWTTLIGLNETGMPSSLTVPGVVMGAP